MPYEYVPDNSEFSSGGSVEDSTSAGGLGRRFSGALDRTEGSLWGVAEGFLGDTAAGRFARDARVTNELESDTSYRKVDEAGGPRSFKDVHGLGDFGRYTAGLAVDSAPALLGIGAAGLVGGIPGALAVGTALGTGDVLDNQRAQSGYTNMATALPLGLAYGAADSLLGIGGMVTRRAAGTGIRALDRAGVNLLDKVGGMKGVAARTGTTMLKTGVVESGSETFQEGMNQLGRMSVDDDETFYNARSAENFQESAIGGGILGGLIGGAAGGWRRSQGFRENEKRDLLASQEKQQVEQEQTQQLGLQRERTKQYLNENLAPLFPEAESDTAAKRRRAEYAKQFGEAAGAPSGEFISSPEDGTERQLDMGQMLSLQVPPSPAELQAQEAARVAKEASNASLKAEQELQQRAAQLGVPPKTTPGLKALRMLEDVQSELTPEEFGALEGVIRAGQYGTVIETLNTREKTRTANAKAQQKAQDDAVKAQQKAVEKAQKEATRAAEKAQRDQERAAQAATPSAAEIAQQADTDNAPKNNTPAASAPSAPMGVTQQPAQPVTVQGAGVSQPTQVSTPAVDVWAGVKPTTRGTVEVVKTNQLDGVAQRNVANTNTPEYAALKASIAKTGIVDPITLTINSMGKPEVFEGNHRLQAARELGLTDVPVVLHGRENHSQSTPITGVKPSSYLAAPVSTPNQPVAPVVTAQAATENVAPKVHRVGTAKPSAQVRLTPKETLLKVNELTGERVALTKGKNKVLSTAEKTRVAEIDTELAATPLPPSADVREHIANLLQDPAVPPHAKGMISAASGFVWEPNGDGVPSLLQVDNPKAQAQIARQLQQTDSNVSKTLHKYGLSAEAITRAMHAQLTTVSAEELGMTGEAAKTSGMREEDEASRAMGAGLVESQNKANVPIYKQADSLFKAAMNGSMSLQQALEAADEFDARPAPKPTAKQLAESEAAGENMDGAVDEKGNKVRPPTTRELFTDALTTAAGSQDKARRTKAQKAAGAAEQTVAERAQELINSIPEAQAVTERAKEREARAAVDQLAAAKAREQAALAIPEKASAQSKALTASLAREMSFWLRTGAGRHVEQWWNERAPASAPQFESLSDGDQLSWAHGVYTLSKEEGTDDQLDDLYNTVAGSLAQTKPSQARPAEQPGDTGRDGEPVSPSGQSGYSVPQANAPKPTVVVKKRRVAVLPGAAKVALNNDAIGPGTAEAAAVNRDVLNNEPDLPINRDGMGGMVSFSASATNPDAGNEAAMPAGVSFPTGQGYANWLATNAKSFWLRRLMKTVAPYLQDVPTHLVNLGDTVPSEVALDLQTNSRGLTVLDPNVAGPNIQVYVRGTDSNTEAVWAHELLHAATLKLLAAGGEAAQKLQALARAVGYSLATDQGTWPINDPAKRNEQEFFKQMFLGQDKKGDADEFLAYAFTSPAFQKIMQRMDPNGKWLPEFRPMRTQAVPKLTLWQRFMDTLASLFGGAKKHAQEIEKIVRVNSEIEARNAAEGGRAKLSDRLEVLLQELLAGPSSPVATPNGQSASIRKPNSASVIPQSINDSASDFLEVLKSKGSNALVKLMMTKDLIANANTMLKGIPQKYLAAMEAVTVQRTAQERAVATIVEDFAKLPKHEQGKGPLSVNKVLKDSTMSKEWAFTPDWLPAGTAKVNPALAARFNQMSRPGQEMVKRVFEHGYDSLKMLQDAVVGNVNSEYDAIINELTKAGKLDEAKAEKAKKAKSLSDFESLLKVRSGWPYAPLRRFGKHVVMAVSARYKQAKDDGDVKLMRELEQDGDHYFVAFAEGKREALRMLGELKDKYPGGGSGTFEKLALADSMMGGRDMLGAMRRLRQMTADSVDDKGLGKETADRVDDMMRQLYLTLLSETSARKGEIHRRNIAGADEDMLRAFSTQGVATAHFIASLKTNGKIEDHLAEMRTEVSATPSDRDEKQRYYNEIMARHSMNLEFNPTPGIDAVLAGSSIYLLLSNPSYFLMNATQPWMMSHPMMAGKFGYAKSATALVQGYKDVMPILKDANFDEKSYAKLPTDVRKAIEALADKGVIQIELGQELGKFRSSPEDHMRHLATALNKLRGAAQGVETLNRLSTAIAAFRLEKQRSGSDETAINYAAQVINETHGDYTGFNAPRFMRTGIGRLTTQFRKFQLIQLSMFARLINRSFKGATQEEKVAARYALAYNLAHLTAIGGVAALPGFTAAAWLVGKAIPDDEPDDPRATLTRAVGKEMADLLWGGVSQASGVPLGGRIGAGTMLSVLPYTDIEVNRKGYSGMLLGLTGPLIGGLMPRAFDGVGMVANGDLWKGAEALVPSGVANISKGIRYQVQGVTQRNGDQALSPEDVSYLDSALQAVGLPTNTIQERTYLAGAKFKADTFYKDRTSSLKKAYSQAFRDNDADAMREVREDWKSTQVTRRELGYKVQPLSELLKAPQEQRKREAGMIGGVGSNKGNAGFLTAMSE